VQHEWSGVAMHKYLMLKFLKESEISHTFSKLFLLALLVLRGKAPGVNSEEWTQHPYTSHRCRV
jgi:hypothetical protein